MDRVGYGEQLYIYFGFFPIGATNVGTFEGTHDISITKPSLTTFCLYALLKSLSPPSTIVLSLSRFGNRS